MAESTDANATDDRLRLLIERIERLTEEAKGIADDIKDVYAEAKAVGYDTKIMREVIRLRAMKPADRREREGNHPGLAHVLLDPVVEEEPHHRGGNRTKRDEPQQAALVRVLREAQLMVDEVSQATAHHPRPVPPEVDEQHQQGPAVEAHIEREPLVLPAEQRWHEDEMPGRRDRQEFGEALDNAEDCRAQEVHLPLKVLRRMAMGNREPRRGRGPVAIVSRGRRSACTAR